MSDKLMLALLGPPEIHIADNPIKGFNSKKVFAMFCYLAVTGGVHMRQGLAYMFWGELPASSAQNNLRKALSNLRKIVNPYIKITRQTVAFNQDSPYRLDVGEFESVAGEEYPERGMHELEAAVELYRGEFLDGLYLHQAPAFEDWVLVQRVRLRDLALRAFHTLADHYGRMGEKYYPIAIDYLRRELFLEPFREKAHHQLMLLLAMSDQRSAALAQYETYVRILADELGIEPGANTRRLYEQILDEALEPGQPIPQFLVQDREQVKPPVFIGREHELKLLLDALDKTHKGQGQMIFIAGGPGRGKTTLMEEFSRRSCAGRSDLLVAKGMCSAYLGAGEPYAPFREILEMLAGNVETQWNAGAISSDHARRLWNAMPLTLQAICERGSHVFNTLIDGVALRSRMTLVKPPLSPDLVSRICSCMDQFIFRMEDVEQPDLYDQVINVFTRIAEQRTLLLMIDDLQWMDKSSARLLFHLGCRLPGRRVMIACACRLEEIIAGREIGQHPLEDLLVEFKQKYENSWIDLAESDIQQGRSFVDNYLDSEPNQLDQGFRDSLYQRTSGHPLFTIEVMQALKVKETLVKESDGSWNIVSEPNWEQLPERVEGVIDQRIIQLPPSLREILEIACVEGNVFSVQTIAGIQGVEEKQVYESMSLLEKRHRLVKQFGEIRIEERFLSQYSFAHVLYRDYLYQGLNPGERRLIHHQVGTVMEEIYQGQIETIALRLVFHFAGDLTKERLYSKIAGERAASVFANEEAVIHLSRALELTHDNDLVERYTLLNGREMVRNRMGDRELQKLDLLALHYVADSMGDVNRKARVALQIADYYWELDEYQESIENCQRALKLLESAPDIGMEARILRRWALSLVRLGDSRGFEIMLEDALKKAQEGGVRWLEGEILRHLGNESLIKNETIIAKSYFDRALPILRETGDRTDEIRILHSLAMSCSSQFDYQKAKEFWTQMLRISREIGHHFFETIAQYSLTGIMEIYGLYDTARDQYRDLVRMARESGTRSLEARARASVGNTSHCMGENRDALHHCLEALNIARKTKEKLVQAYILNALGYVLMEMDRSSEAEEYFHQSIASYRKINQERDALEPLAGLAELDLHRGDHEEAMVCIEEILEHLEQGQLPSTEQPLRVYWTCYRGLLASRDPRAEMVLDQAHGLLQKWAVNIDEDDLRLSFLENVAANRRIQTEWMEKSRL